MDQKYRIDRGGLFYINDATLIFFRAVEIRTQELLPDFLVSSKEKETLVRAIMDDEDVQECWSVLSIDITNEADAADLLYMLVDMCGTTLRGFSMTSMWIEEYKRANDEEYQEIEGITKGTCKQ